jgi:RND family efflux transporter MFP subunit
MRIVIVSTLCLAVGFGVAWMVLGSASPSGLTSASAEAASEPSAQQYTCGMHPEVVSDEPGICPICNMKLTPKKQAGESASGVTIDPVTRQNMGLVTADAHYRTLQRTVRAFGRVAYREPNRHSVNLKVKGWVEQLFVDEIGEQVFKGQPLLRLYAPELVAAQREYLVAARAADVATMSELVSAAADRLRNWDISDDQIERLSSDEDILQTMTIRAPADGIVVNKMVNEGDRLLPGKELFEVVDLSTVWVTAHVYELDAPFVSVGQQALVRFPKLPGEQYTGRVEYVSPFLGDDRQIEIRITLENPNQQLKPQMYAEVSLSSELSGDQLVVPRKAVINSGVRELVYVAASENTYEPRLIRTGAVGADDMVQVASGLQAGEKVVVSGQFLLDSESRLSEALGGHMHGEQSAPEADDHEAIHASSSDDPYDIHTCPMPEHFHVLNYGPGTCPECGMDLVPTTETDNTDVYVCPMPSCGVAESEPGLCPVCNMHLMKYESESGDDK